jgi:FdhD protein
MWLNIIREGTSFHINNNYIEGDMAMASSQFFIERRMEKYEHKHLTTIYDPVVVEVPLTIVLNDTELVTMACSPDAYEQLAVGYLLSEGILNRNSTIKNLDISGTTIRITAENIASFTNLRGPSLNTCMGKSFTITLDSKQEIACSSEYFFNAEDLLHLIQRLDETSDTFKRTGGVHSAALGYNSELLIRYEDIGRHNAVDKVFGNAFLNGIGVNDKCLILSGRIASEILIKAFRNGVPLILSRSAPTLKTVELADKCGMTIVGFARGSRFNVYSHSERILV